MRISKLFTLVIAFMVLIVVEPFLATVQNRDLMSGYPALVGGFILFVAVLIGWRLYTISARAKAQRNLENEKNVGEKNNHDELNENQYIYQEPLHQLDHQPVRIFNKKGHPSAILDIRFKNNWEKLTSVTGFMDYSNILIKLADGEDIVYFQTMPIRKSLRRYKWKVFLNREEHAILEMETGMKNLKRGLSFKCFYHVEGKTYVLETSKFGTKTLIYLKGKEGNPVFHSERSFIGMGKKGRDESRGRKHLIDDVKDPYISFIEKVGVYQQIITRIK
ncbi:hypothetical protein HUG20_08450 [Salicibibacter cibi]|uniref:Tubby C-terminal domain-containing protein n=1 Tax=Salicibibacter cibi TaxID=2743001 RepID=A0A7T6ZAL5_9BACI|nr:hypothetical protein [Salicibibacter cibi]QQK79911.1 hypothetical protein HUG20_08450 [Salicibibacter cibi]